MRLSNILYFFREAAKSLSRNRLLTFATISTVTICILILGMAVLLSLNAERFMSRLESDVQMIAFLDRSLSDAEIDEVQEEIEKSTALNPLNSYPGMNP